MTIPISSALARQVAIQKEVMTALGVNADSVPYFTYIQDIFPYWTNRLSTATLPPLEEDYSYSTYNFIQRIIIGHATEDYDGEVESRLHTWVPNYVEYMNNRPRLQHDAATTGLNDLIHAQIINLTGLRYFPTMGPGVVQIGCEFTLQCEFVEDIDQAYS